MTLEDKDGTKVIRFGKMVGFMYPDVYFEFVSLLHREHPDLVRAMQFAQVKLDDGSARDFLNTIFETEVTSSMPMEEGFKIFYYKLQQRRTSQLAQEKIEKTANDRFQQEHKFRYRPEEDAGKPLFPSIEEMEDKGIK